MHDVTNFRLPLTLALLQAVAHVSCNNAQNVQAWQEIAESLLKGLNQEEAQLALILLKPYEHMRAIAVKFVPQDIANALLDQDTESLRRMLLNLPVNAANLSLHDANAQLANMPNIGIG